MRILVVEDEPKVAEFVRSTLHDAQFAVDVAHDGATSASGRPTTICSSST
jgi:DNA-binding response OmpR family regulator